MSTPDSTAPPSAIVRESNGLRWLWLSALIVALDQLAKLLVVRHLQLYERTVLLPFLDFTRLHNTGAAFSVLAGASGWQREFFIALASVVCLGIVIWLSRLKARSQAVLAAGLALIAGGALGNMVDRVRLHHVIDFIHFHWRGWEFPAFNVADSAITVGAALLLLDALLEARRGRQRGTPPP
jgi:signal peptidase II